MAVTTTIKTLINHALAPIGLRLDTLAAERQEMRRLNRLEEGGYFDSPCFPLPEAFSRMDPGPVLGSVDRFSSRFGDLIAEDRNPTGYSFDNPFFASPDAEVLYSMVRALEPATIVEVGCGNSTRLIRLAVMDGGFESRIVGIDPHPRRDVAALTDEMRLCPVESDMDLSLFSGLRQGDILSIDSSHELRAGNDLVFLYLNVLPQLRSGVVVHIHDVFLPYDYRKDWVIEEKRQYSEQYIVQSMLHFGRSFEVLWAGHFLQKTRAEFFDHFPNAGGRDAQSLWLRKVPGVRSGL